MSPASQSLKAKLQQTPLRRAVVGARHLGLSAEDVFIGSFPRSGNTWLRFLLAELATGVPADFERLETIVPQVGAQRGAPAVLPGGGRLIKTHEPHRSSYKRAVYLVRDVRAVVLSLYRLTREDLDDLSGLGGFIREFMRGTATPYGSWVDHVRSWIGAAQRPDSNIVIRHYEDMASDPRSVLREACELAGLPVDEEKITAALGHNSHDRLRELAVKDERFLEQRFGRRAIGGPLRVSWQEALGPEHLAALGPALELNQTIGYGSS